MSEFQVDGAHSFQRTLFKLKKYWAERGCIIQEPYDVEVGAGTMCPETFLRVLGPKPYRVAYVQPSRRPADGRYGENPNRLYKHQQLQVILKPSPDDVIDQYLGSLEAIGIDLAQARHQVRRRQLGVADAGRLGHRLAGDAGRPGDHAVHLLPAVRRHRPGPGAGRAHLRPGAAGGVPAGCGQRLRHRVGAGRSSTATCAWPDELQFSVYNFEMADVATLWQLFELHEEECQRLLGGVSRSTPDKKRFPLLPAYDQVLKCSHLFNLLDARGAISVTERVGVIARVRKLAVGVAQAWVDQQRGRWRHE